MYTKYVYIYTYGLWSILLIVIIVIIIIVVVVVFVAAVSSSGYVCFCIIKVRFTGIHIRYIGLNKIVTINYRFLHGEHIGSAAPIPSCSTIDD